MVRSKDGEQPKTIWTYAYQIVPSQAEDRLRSLKALLDDEHTDAMREDRTWVGRMVLERQITHILVVSDSPDLDGQANTRLQAGLKELNVAYSITVPMPVAGEGATSAS